MATAVADLVFIDAAGFHYPDFPTVLAGLEAEYRTIYGADALNDASEKDRQWIAVQARGQFDCMELAAAVYNSFSPTTALGDALSRNVKLNGMARRVPTHSQVDVELEGGAGTTITNGQVEDTNGRRWDLPASVVIPVEAITTVTATAVEAGAITALPGTVTKIATPTRGWLSVTNPSAASPGDPIETDAELRQRQSVSTMNPSQSPFDGIRGAVAAVNGVTRMRGYENKTNAADANGQVEHSIAMVVEGGDLQAIADAIASRKPTGTDTAGTTTVATTDQYGEQTDISFYRPTPVTVTVEVRFTPQQGFLAGTKFTIAKAVADYINGLRIGDDVYLGRLYTPANLGNVGEGDTFVIDSIRISRTGVPGLDTDNLELSYIEMAQCNAGTADTPVDVDVDET